VNQAIHHLASIWRGDLPASNTRRLSLRTQAPAVFWFGVLLWLLATALFAWTASVSADACTNGVAPISLVAVQLLGLLLPSVACDSARTGLALAIDYGLIVAYTLLLAYPVTWALQRRVEAADASAVALGWLTSNVHLFMWAFPLFDLLEDVVTPAALVPVLNFGPAMVVALASAGKFASMGVLTWVLLRGWMRR
jgi:hypothetical protein